MVNQSSQLPWSAVGLFFLLDIVLAAALIALLCCPNQRLPERVERWFPLRGRWLWILLVALVAALHLTSGAMVWLPVMLHRR